MPYDNAMGRVSNKFDSLETMAKTIAVPNQYRPRRMPTFPALERTSILSFTSTGIQSVPSAGTANYVLCRSPAFPLWHGKIVGDIGACKIDLNLDAAGASASQPVADDVEPMFSVAGDFVGAAHPVVVYQGLSYVLLGGQASTHGGVNPYCIGIQATVTAGSFLYADITATYLRWSASGVTTTSGDAGVNLQVSGTQYGTVWSIPADVFAVRVSSVTWFAGTGVTNTISSTQWGVTTTRETATNLQKAVCLTSPVTNGLSLVRRVLPAFPMPAYNESKLPYESSRATAVGVLFSNVTAVLNKEGTVECCRVPAGAYPVFSPLDWDFATVIPAERYFGPLEKGLYAFTLSDAQSDTYRDHFRARGSDQNPLFDLEQVGYFSLIRFTDLDSASTTNLAITLDRHIEFRSTSQLFPLGFSSDTLESYHQTQIALAQMGTFMENPVHLATIARMAATAIKAAWPYAKPVVMAAAHKGITAAHDWARTKLGNMQQSTPGAQPRQARPKPKKGPQNRKKVRASRR